MNLSTRSIGLFVLFGLLSASALAQSRNSTAIIAGRNSLYADQDPPGFSAFIADFKSDGTAASVSINQNFIGLNANGGTQTMNFTGSATATGNYGILRTTGVGTLSNTLFNADNPPYYDEQNAETNPDGIPDVFLAAGSAGYSDILQFGGTASGYKSRYIFNIHGNVTGSAYARTFLDVTIAGNREFFEIQGTGEIATTISTKAYFIGTSGLTMDVSLTSRFEATTNGTPDGTNLNGASLFGQTVTLSGIEVTDGAGNVVTNWTVSSTSGTNYIPEPATGLLVSASMLSLFRRRR